MANISFSMTTQALKEGRKTVTRRRWVYKYHQQWTSWFDRGKRQHQAWDKNPRAGGKRIGSILLTCRPYRERVRDMPISDLQREGGLWISREQFAETIGARLDEFVSVIRFRFTPKG